jgi:N-acetylglucosamine malate deacetylase 1
MFELKGKKLLVIAPHPDDEMISCGGLILKAIKEEAKVFVLYITIGPNRQLVTGKTDVETRFKEIDAVAKACGFEHKTLFVGEEYHLKLDAMPIKDLIDPIEDFIEEFKPDIIVLPPRDSFNQDHRTIFNACIACLRPVPQKIRHFVPFVLEFEEPHSWSVGDEFKPNFYFDISDVLEKKIEYLKLHETQYREQPFTRSGENLIRLAMYRGNEVGTEAAEAYKIHRGFIK